MKLSNSAIDTYRMCPRKYKLHYEDRIRPKHLDSPLFFGSAIDEALNRLLLEKKKVLTKEENELLKKTPWEVFLDNFIYVEINGKTYYAPSCLLIRYNKKDFDDMLIYDEDYENLSNLTFDELEGLEGDNDYIDFAYEYLEARKKGAKFLDDENLLFNFICWLSLKNKAKLLLEAYEKDILPKFDEIISVQKKIELENSEGDYITGYEDFKTKIGDIIYTGDNKTSSLRYQRDRVKKSQQLMIYTESEELEHGLYAVVNKNIKRDKIKTCKTCGNVVKSRHKTCPKKIKGKRCDGEFDIEIEPRVETQIIKDKIDEKEKEEIFKEIEEIGAEIKNKRFPQNLDACDMQFGKPCIYRDLCHKNSMEGLIKKEKSYYENDSH